MRTQFPIILIYLHTRKKPHYITLLSFNYNYIILRKNENKITYSRNNSKVY